MAVAQIQHRTVHLETVTQVNIFNKDDNIRITPYYKFTPEEKTFPKRKPFEVKRNIAKNKFNTGLEENSEILQINVKYNCKSYIMSLKRYDDLFLQTKTFFDQNGLPDNLIKPVLMKICESMNHIFMVYNTELSKFNKDYLNSLEKLWNHKTHETVEEGEEEANSSILSSFSEMEYSEETLPENLNKSF
jgi:hypothetical protein